MKKVYMKPTTTVWEMKQQQIICASPSQSLQLFNQPTLPGNEIPTTIEQW